MGSKISWVRLLKEDIKWRSWLVALSFLGLFLLLPVQLLLGLDAQRELLALEQITEETLREVYIQNVSFDPQGLPILVLCVIAFLAGLSGFYYVHSTEKLDFFHSLPVKRGRMFAIQFFSGVLTAGVPYLLSTFLCTAIGHMAGLARAGDTGRIMEAYVVHMLYYVVFYGVAVLGVMLTGKLIVSMLAFPVLMFLGPLCTLLKTGLSRNFFTTYGIDAWSEEWGLRTSPAGICLDVENGMADYFAGEGFPGFRLLLLLVVIAALLLLDLYLYKKRKTEMAGHSIAFPLLEIPLKFLIGIPASLGIGLFVMELAKTQQDIWFFCGTALCAVIVCAVLDFIYYLDIREIFRRKMPLLGVLAGSLLLGCMFRFDWIGYDAYLPAKDQVVSASLYQQELNSRALCENGELTWIGDQKEYLDEHLLEDAAPIYAMAQSGVENADSVHSEGVSVDLLLSLEDGRRVYRTYVVDADVYTEQMDQLFDNETYKESLFAIYDMPEEIYFGVESCGLYGYGSMIRMQADLRERLLEAYKEELKSVRFSDISGEELVGMLTFYCGESMEDRNLMLDGPYPVLKSFTRTQAILAEIGIQFPESIDASQIESIEVYGVLDSTSYGDSQDVYMIEETYQGNKLFTARTDIEEIAASLDFSKSTVVDYSVRTSQNKYYSVYVSFDNFQQFSSFYLIEEELPDCIRRAFES